MWKKIMPRYFSSLASRCMVNSVSLVPVSPGRYEVTSIPSDVVDKMAFDSFQVMETDLEILFRAGINPTIVSSPSFVERPDTKIIQGHEILDALSRQPESRTESQPEPQSEPSNS